MGMKNKVQIENKWNYPLVRIQPTSPFEADMLLVFSSFTC